MLLHRLVVKITQSSFGVQIDRDNLHNSRFIDNRQGWQLDGLILYDRDIYLILSSVPNHENQPRKASA